MKLSSRDLAKITDVARAEMRDRKQDIHGTPDEHLGRCWVMAMIRVMAGNKVTLMCFDKEAEHLTEMEDV